MGSSSLIQVYVARADLFICLVLHILWIAVYVAFALGLIALVYHGVRLWR